MEEAPGGENAGCRDLGGFITRGRLKIYLFNLTKKLRMHGCLRLERRKHTYTRYVCKVLEHERS
jgi:hypothetical protein